MTVARKAALVALRDKVAAGVLDDTSAFDDVSQQVWLSDAFNGSLDAAKALHDAVLPTVNQYSIVTDPTCLCAKVCGWPDGLSIGREIYGEGWSEDNPARAWLLAILSALIAEAE